MTARHTRMTPEAVQETCLKHNGFETPSLNSSLYLHFKGYSIIENLEPYTETKALWLESNGASFRQLMRLVVGHAFNYFPMHCAGLQKLEGLNTLTKLRCLYLQQNLLTRIENVQCLVGLMYNAWTIYHISASTYCAALPCLCSCALHGLPAFYHSTQLSAKLPAGVISNSRRVSKPPGQARAHWVAS